jgi:hypothetical protein
LPGTVRFASSCQAGGPCSMRCVERLGGSSSSGQAAGGYGAM